MKEENNKVEIPLWAKIISWIIALIFFAFIFSMWIIGAMGIGLGLFKAIQAYGLIKAISICALGISGSGLFIVMLFFAMAIIKRITKWKWLQIPTE